MSRLSGPEQAIADLIRLLFRGARTQNSTEISYIPDPVKAIITTYSAATRVIGTNYQNAALRPRMVIFGGVTIIAAAGDTARIQGYVGGADPAGPLVANMGFLASATPINYRGNFVLMVPNGWWYRIDFTTTGTGSCAYGTWLEVQL